MTQNFFSPLKRGGDELGEGRTNALVTFDLSADVWDGVQKAATATPLRGKS